MGDGIHPKEALQYRLSIMSDIRRFLETEDVFSWGGKSHRIHGLNLPQEALEKIYRQNFIGLLGTQPRKLDKERVLSACSIWHQLASASPDTLEINLKEFELVVQRIREAL
jgi:hypothetical protein